MVTCTTIKIKTVDQRLTVVQQPILSSGDVGTVRVEYELDSYWEGFTPTGTFYTNKKPDDVYEQPLVGGACDIPWEVLQEDGILFIGLRGVDGAGLVKTAAPVRYRVEKGSPRGSAAALEPTPDLYDRIVKHLGEPCAGGSGSGVHVGTDEPTDGSEVWIDTDDEDMEYQEKICGETIVPIVNNISVELDDDGMDTFTPTFDIVVGRQYVMTINGTAYVATAIEQDGMGVVLDTVNMVGIVPNDEDSMMIAAIPYASQTVTLSVEEHNITKIPETYLPQTVKRYVITLTDEDVADGLVMFVKSCTYDSFIDILYGGGEVIIKKTSQLSGAYGGDHYFKPVSWNFTQIEQSDGSVQNILGMTIADYVKVFGASSEKISLLFFGSGIPPEL